MKRIVPSVAIVMALIGGSATDARAQGWVFATPRPAPIELGLFGGAWNFDSDGVSGVGGRLTLNRADWFGIETSVERKTASASASVNRMFVLNARFLLPAHPMQFAQAFFTAGGGVATGPRPTLFPMLSFGVQTISRNSPLAIRTEIQRFPGSDDRRRTPSRLTLSVVLLLDE